MSSARRPILALLALSAAVLACQGGTGAAPSGGRVAVSVSEIGMLAERGHGPVRAGHLRRHQCRHARPASSRSSWPTRASSTRSRTSCPGFVVNMSTRVDGGTYQMICGNTQAPKGALTVTGGAAPSLPPNAVVDQAKLDAVRDGYADLRQRAGDRPRREDRRRSLPRSREATSRGRRRSTRRPASRGSGSSRSPSSSRTSTRPSTSARRTSTAASRIPGSRASTRSRRCSSRTAPPTASRRSRPSSRANVAELKKRVDALVIDPRVMARGAGELIEEVAQSKMTGEEDRYSKADLVSIDANVDGSAEIVDGLRPILTDARCPVPGQARRGRRRRSRRSSPGTHDGRRLQAVRRDHRRRPQAPPGPPGRPVRAARRAAGPPRAGGVDRPPCRAPRTSPAAPS